MGFINLSDIIDSIYALLFYLSIIILTIIKDEHYHCRVHASKGLRKLFFNKIRQDSIPLISLSTTIEFFITFPILIIVKLNNPSLSLKFMFAIYLLVPWICLSLLILVAEVVMNIREKIKIQDKKKIERQRLKEQGYESVKRRKHK